MRLFAVRHGATEYSRERRFAGSRDVPLTTDGRLQADAVAQALAGAGVAARVRGALARLIAAHAGETAVLVSHAIVVRLIVLAALGLGPERLWAVDASPAGITEIEYLGDWATVHRMNTLAHLDDLPEAGS